MAACVGLAIPVHVKDASEIVDLVSVLTEGLHTSTLLVKNYSTSVGATRSQSAQTINKSNEQNAQD